jgi:hypothetical protein
MAYRNLSSYTRSVLFNDGNNNVEVCDDAAGGTVVSGNLDHNDWRGPGWYRFTDAAGTQMATTAPSLPPPFFDCCV